MKRISELVFDNATFPEAIRLGLDIRFTDRGSPYCNDRRYSQFLLMCAPMTTFEAVFTAIDHALEGDMI